MLPLISFCLFACQILALEFTIAGGQIFTPGLAVLNAPQPGTPLGGETLHVSLDITANGRLPLPPYPDENPTAIHNITMFLYSYETGKNFTITNGTEGFNGASLGDMMAQEEGSTVKHINWMWPNCLVGDGQPQDAFSDRGVYNISIRQNFRLNDEDYYTIFDIPISVTNRIDAMDGTRPSCDDLLNPMLEPEVIDAASANEVGVLFAPGDSTVVETFASNAEASEGGAGADFIDDGESEGLGPLKPEAKPEDGLGGAGSLSPLGAVSWICAISMVMASL